jgi:hypothetical protein
MESAILALAISVLMVVLIFHASMTARLRGIERKLNALLRHHGVDPTQGLPLSDRVRQLAADPSTKIEAIKVYREETGAGLAEAKEVIEAFVAGR